MLLELVHGLKRNEQAIPMGKVNNSEIFLPISVEDYNPL